MLRKIKRYVRTGPGQILLGRDSQILFFFHNRSSCRRSFNAVCRRRSRPDRHDVCLGSSRAAADVHLAERDVTRCRRRSRQPPWTTGRRVTCSSGCHARERCSSSSSRRRCDVSRRCFRPTAAGAGRGVLLGDVDDTGCRRVGPEQVHVRRQ